MKRNKAYLLALNGPNDWDSVAKLEFENFPGCCALNVVHNFPRGKSDASFERLDNDWGSLMAMLLVKEQAHSIKRLKTLGFKEINRFTSRETGNRLVTLFRR